MTAHVMNLLDHGIPITLLCDLASITEPDSAAINSVERPATDSIWLQAAKVRSELSRSDTA
jgi:hypothetical protein